MVIYPAEIAAELGMTEQNKNGGVVTRALLREAVYRTCPGLSHRQADEILEATFAEILRRVRSRRTGEAALLWSVQRPLQTSARRA